jgi:hypothetical protein
VRVVALPFESAANIRSSICPGRFLAERVGLQFAAAVASAYQIEPVDGEAFSKPVEFDDGIVR